MQRNYDATALLALPGVKPGSTPEAGFLSWTRPYLVREVRNLGVDVAAVRGADSLDTKHDMAYGVVSPEYLDKNSVVLKQLGNIALSEFGVLRNIVKSARVEHAVPQLNPHDLRILGRDKYGVAADFLNPADAFHRVAALVRPGLEPRELQEVVASIPGEIAVAKPNGGMRSEGIIVGPKSEVIEQLRDKEIDYIVEEKLDFSAVLPSVKAIDESEQRRLDAANELGVNKELRLYYFGKGVWDAVARVAQPGAVDFRDDKWLHIDLDTIPEELFKKGDDIIDRLRERVGTDEINIALDWVFASTVSHPEASWQVMEINVAEPQLVQLSEHYDVGSRQHTKLANQIARIALNR